MFPKHMASLPENAAAAPIITALPSDPAKKTNRMFFFLQKPYYMFL